MCLPIDNNDSPDNQNPHAADRCAVSAAIAEKLAEIDRLRELQERKPHLHAEIETKIQNLSLVVRAMERFEGRAATAVALRKAIEPAAVRSAESDRRRLITKNNRRSKKIMEPVIRQLDSEDEIRRKTKELLGDTDDDGVKNFVDLLENFKNADAETAYYLIGVAQRAAFEKTVCFENAFRAFAGHPLISEAEDGQAEDRSSEVQIDRNIH